MDNRKLIRIRIVWMLLILLLLFFALGVRLAFLQVVKHSHYDQLAQSQRMRPTTVDAKRGTIFDRNGMILALSVGADAVYAVPSSARDHASAAQGLAQFLDHTEEELLDFLSNVDRSVWLGRRLTWETSEAIRDLDIPGIRFIERPQRYYPQGTLAAQVLGFAGMDNQGLEGLEYFYDGILSGTPGTWLLERDAAQRKIPGGDGVLTPPVSGTDLVLTIDGKIQYIAERELEKAVHATQSARGVAIFLDSKTGAIVANAVYPSFDPNEYQKYASAERRNTAVVDQFEPGSTFKILTAAASLDLNIVQLDTRFNTGSSWEVAGGRIRSWNRIGHGEQSFVQTLATSDNIAYAQLAVEMEPRRFHPYLADFGLGQRLGVDFPGEIAGRLPAPGEIRFGETLQWANIGFGQGVAVTPLQLTAAVNAIANRGVLLRPFFVAETLDNEGNVLQSTPVEVLAHPISASTADKVAYMMRQAVVNGTGSQADIAGIGVAGKTGTAEVPGLGGYGEDRIASFVGYAPADNPVLTGIVILYYPRQDVRYGSVLAAPVFRDIMEQALECLGIRPQGPDEVVPEAAIPNVRSMSYAQAAKTLQDAGLLWSYFGEGRYIADQRPVPGPRSDSDTVVALYLYDKEYPGLTTVPELMGLTIRDAAALLAANKLNACYTGLGLVHEQIPNAGEVVEEGTVVEVQLHIDD